MYCTKCGAKIDDDAKFCNACGKPTRLANITTNAPVVGNPSSLNPKKKSKKSLFILLGAILLSGIIAFVIIFALNGSPKAKVSKELKMANRYMDELQYEMAIASYTKVIEIDPKNVDAYLGLSDCYEKLDEDEKAVDTLITGYKICEEEELISRLEDIVTGIISEYGDNEEYDSAIFYIDSVNSSLGKEIFIEERQSLSALIEANIESLINDVNTALDGTIGTYLEDLCWQCEDPEAFFPQISERQGTIHTLSWGWYLPDEWVVDNGFSTCINEEHLLQRIYFETGYEASLQELNLEPDLIYYQDGIPYYLVFGYAMGFPYGSTTLTNREIISCDGEICEVKYTAHSTIWNEQWIDDDAYYDGFDGYIIFTLKRDPKSVFYGLRVIDATVIP